jgi:hypothetical protein
MPSALQNTGQSMRNRLRSHRLAITVKMTSSGSDALLRSSPCEADGPDRLGRGSTLRTGDAGDGKCPVSTAALKCTPRHSGRYRFADRTMRCERIARNAQNLDLGVIRVGDETAVEPAGTSSDCRQTLADPPTRTGFCCRQTLPVCQKLAADFGGQGFERSLIASDQARTECRTARISRVYPAATRSSDITPKPFFTFSSK